MPSQTIKDQNYFFRNEKHMIDINFTGSVWKPVSTQSRSVEGEDLYQFYQHKPIPPIPISEVQV